MHAETITTGINSDQRGIANLRAACILAATTRNGVSKPEQKLAIDNLSLNPIINSQPHVAFKVDPYSQKFESIENTVGI
jgi:hypothetical protein